MWEFVKSATIAGGLSLLSCSLVFSQDANTSGAGASDQARVGTMESRTSVRDLPDGAGFGDLQQVRVTGGNPRARTMFHAFVRDLREDFRWSIYKSHQANAPVKGRNAWEIPIQVELWGETTDVFRGHDARMSVELLPDNRFYLCLDVRLHDRFEEPSFRLEAMRALIAEQMLTPFIPQPSALGASELIAPEWLVHGFDAMIEHRRTGQRSVFYAGVLKSGLFLKPEELLAEQEPLKLDPISYAIYRISSSAMVTALLDQPEGDRGMRELLGDLPLSGGGVMPLLKKHFPAFREMDQGLEKWWMLQVATMGQQQRFEFLGRHETEQWLDEAITIRFDGTEEAQAAAVPAKRGFFERFKKPKEEQTPAEPFVGTLDQYPEFIERVGAKEKLTIAFNQIQNLKAVGFPLYRPLLDRYEQVIEKLAAGEVNGISAELSELSQLRATIRDTLERSEDYLNHFEATQSPQRSDVFDDYMRLRKEFERRGRPVREDRITKFMDALEREFR